MPQGNSTPWGRRPTNPSLLSVVDPEAARGMGYAQLDAPPQPTVLPTETPTPQVGMPSWSSLTREIEQGMMDDAMRSTMAPGAQPQSLGQGAKQPGFWGKLGGVLQNRVLPIAAMAAPGIAAGSRNPDPFGAFGDAMQATAMMPLEIQRRQAEIAKMMGDLQYRQAQAGELGSRAAKQDAEREQLIPSEAELNAERALLTRAQAITQEEMQRMTSERGKLYSAQSVSEREKAAEIAAKRRLVEEQIEAGIPRAQAENQAAWALRNRAQAGVLQAQETAMPSQVQANMDRARAWLESSRARNTQAEAALTRANREQTGSRPMNEREYQEQVRTMTRDKNSAIRSVKQNARMTLGGAMTDAQLAQIEQARDAEVKAIETEYEELIRDLKSRRGGGPMSPAGNDPLGLGIR